MADLRVILVGDDPYFRDGLAARLSEVPGITIASEEEAGDIVLWDCGHDSGELDPEAEPFGLALPVVALVADEARASRAIAAGARGAALRRTEPVSLARGLEAAAAGWMVLDGPIADALVAPRARERAEPHDELTAREIETLELLTGGLSNREIARRLSISEHTAKFHVNAILGKLGAHNRAEAIVRAARLGLVVL